MSKPVPKCRLSLRESSAVTFFRGAKRDYPKPHAAKFQMISLDSNRIVVEELQIADSFWSRFVGLQFRRELPVGHGLLLVPCRSIHTCWMRFAIDVIFLDVAGTVLDINTSLRPWRTAASKVGRSHATLEVAAGTSQMSVGERLQVVRRDAHTTESQPLSPRDVSQSHKTHLSDSDVKR